MREREDIETETELEIELELEIQESCSFQPLVRTELTQNATALGQQTNRDCLGVSNPVSEVVSAIRWWGCYTPSGTHYR